MSNAEVNAAAVYGAMIACAERTSIVADHTKFGVRALKLYAGWSRSVELVSDRAAEGEIAEALERAGAGFRLAAPG